MSSRPTPDQQRAIDHLAGSLSISAAAGSGKTRVLAERFANAVAPVHVDSAWQPAAIDDILTVTFTEKAAGEIAERVRRVFLARGLPDEARRVDTAWISTIHGLCARLLRGDSLEAGLDPRFRILPVVEAGLLRQEALEAVLREAASAGSGVRSLLERYGAAESVKAVGDIEDRLRSMGARPQDVALETGQDPRELLREALLVLPALLERLSAYPAPGARLLKTIGGYRAAIDALTDLAADHPGDPEALAEVLRVGLETARAGGGHGKAQDVVDDVEAERRELTQRVVRYVTTTAAATLLELVRRFAERYASMKRERGALDFSDLELETLSLLEQDLAQGRPPRTSFRMAMIDEFQDTNRVQVRLASLLCDDLCTVGDERQSIYRFRFADLAVYRAHNERMRERGALMVDLAQNFRSHPDVLGFVNTLFAAPGMLPTEVTPLIAGRAEVAPPVWPTGMPRIALLAVHKTDAKADVALSLEADAVARRLRELADRGVDQGDMVVLLRALTHVETYAAALERQGLDCVVATGDTFFGRPEIALIRAWLALVVNRHDDGPLVEVLCSPAGGMSDDGLARLCRAAARGTSLWDASGVELDEGEAAVLGRVRASVDTARRTEARRTLAELIYRGMEDLDYDLELLGRGEAGRLAYANILKLARLADDYEHDNGRDVPGFCRHLRLKEELGDRETAITATSMADGVVRIMSIHASKGLEFPVVAAPGLGGSIQHDSRFYSLTYEGDAPRLLVKLPSSTGDKAVLMTPEFEAARVQEGEREAEEGKRLLYVACTRAREGLVLAGVGALDKEGNGDQPLTWVRDALGLSVGPEASGMLTGPDGIGVDVVRMDEQEPIAEPRTALRQAAERPTPAWAPSPVSHDVGPAPSARGVLPTVSYSALDRFASCPLRYWAMSVARLGTADGVGTDDPLRFGDATHRVLQLVGRDLQAPSAERLHAVASVSGLPADGEPRLRAAVEGYLGSAVAARVGAATDVAHEVPFAVPLDTALLVGTIDLLATESGGTLIVDYKTGLDALGQGEHENHRTQADCYALAALSGGASAVRVVFVGVETAGEQPARELVFDYAAAQTDDLRAALSAKAAALAEGPYEPLSRYDARACRGCPAQRSVCPVQPPPRAKRS